MVSELVKEAVEETNRRNRESKLSEARQLIRSIGEVNEGITELTAQRAQLQARLQALEEPAPVTAADVLGS